SATGNALEGQTHWDRWGVLSSLEIEFYQPIYTFGAISSGRKAALAGLRAETALLQREEERLAYEIAELYFGYQKAFEFIQLTTEADERLDGIFQNLKSPSQRDHLQTVVNEVKIRK